VKLPRLEMTLTRKPTGPTVGLDLDSDSIAAVEPPAADRAVRADVQPLPSGAIAGGEIVDPDAVSSALVELYKRSKLSRQVRLGVASQGVAFRIMRLPLIENPERLRSAVRFQAGEEIPMPLDSAVLDHQIVAAHVDGDGGRQIDVAVVAARRDYVEGLLDVAKKAGLDPVGIDLAAFGMIRAMAGTEPVAAIPGNAEGEGGQYIPTSLYCSLGGITNLAIARGRTCLFSRAAQFSARGIAEDLARQTGLQLEHAEQWLIHVGFDRPTAEIEGDPGTVEMTRSVLDANLTRLTDELRLSLDYYGAQEGAAPIEDVALCGWGSAIPGISEQIGAALARPVSTTPPVALSGYPEPAAARLTLPYGLSLEA
jgi:type IV pilus assembly protein PilM